jgi:hypothetical protein
MRKALCIPECQIDTQSSVLCLETLVLEGRNHLLNKSFIGTQGIRRCSRKAIFLHLRSLRLSGTAIARLIICMLLRSLEVDRISFLKEESGGSMKFGLCWHVHRKLHVEQNFCNDISLVLSGCCNVGSLKVTALLGLEFLGGRVSPRCKGHPSSRYHTIVH